MEKPSKQYWLTYPINGDPLLDSKIINDDIPKYQHDLIKLLNQLGCTKFQTLAIT